MKHLLTVFFLLFSFTLSLRAETYVTEEGVQIDRCACAWFILRFVDEEAQFKFFKNGEKPPAGIGFDYYGAPYFHKGPDCSFTSFIKKHPNQKTTNQKALQEINQLVNDVFAWRDGPKSNASLLRLAIDEFNQNHTDQEIFTSSVAIFDYVYLKFGGILPSTPLKQAIERLKTEQQIDYLDGKFQAQKDPSQTNKSALLTFLKALQN